MGLVVLRRNQRPGPWAAAPPLLDSETSPQPLPGKKGVTQSNSSQPGFLRATSSTSVSFNQVTAAPLPHLFAHDASPRPWPSRRSLAVIFGLALLGRLMALLSVVTSHPHNWLFSHPWEMGLLANTLLHGQGYSSPFGGSTGPTAFIAPGYPTLIAGVFLVFGSDTFASALAMAPIIPLPRFFRCPPPSIGHDLSIRAQRSGLIDHGPVAPETMCDSERNR